MDQRVAITSWVWVLISEPYTNQMYMYRPTDRRTDSLVACVRVLRGTETRARMVQTPNKHMYMVLGLRTEWGGVSAVYILCIYYIILYTVLIHTNTHPLPLAAATSGRHVSWAATDGGSPAGGGGEAVR